MLEEWEILRRGFLLYKSGIDANFNMKPNPSLYTFVRKYRTCIILREGIPRILSVNYDLS